MTLVHKQDSYMKVQDEIRDHDDPFVQELQTYIAAIKYKANRWFT